MFCPHHARRGTLVATRATWLGSLGSGKGRARDQPLWEEPLHRGRVKELCKRDRPQKGRALDVAEHGFQFFVSRKFIGW